MDVMNGEDVDDTLTTPILTKSPIKLRVALFGPQVTDWTATSLQSLQSSLQQDSRLEFLRLALGSVSSLWPHLKESFGHDAFPGDKKLEALEGFAVRAERLDTQSLTNTELAPLTVVLQTVEWIQHFGLSSSKNKGGLSSITETQGFCIGFLTAAAFATAGTWAEAEANVANAVRLAACIGVAVDSHAMLLDPPERSKAVSVRWTTSEDRAYLESCLDTFDGAHVSCITDHKDLTVTLPAKHQALFCARMKDAKLSTKIVGLSGCYHHRVHEHASGLVARIATDNPQILGLGDAEQLRLPLRSTADSALITRGSLGPIAVKLILCKRAHWYQTVKSTLENHNLSEFDDAMVDLIPLGGRGLTVPRSLRPTRASVEASNNDNSSGVEPLEEIAIVGMACRFAQADDVDSFWNLLQRGESAVGKMPSERFDAAHITTREPQLPNYWGNFIQNPDTFDHRFFSISGREAKSMDPQQRLALQVAYEAVESAGFHNRGNGAAEAAEQTHIGCYLGVGAVEYENNLASHDANAFAAVGTLRAFISGRISHFFGWTGPSITYDTACSSSAVAIHSACKAVLAGECASALAGGVNIITSPFLHQNLAAASFLNPNGASRAFDAGAAGYCRGEGAGMILVKKLSRARADGDHILGVIAASAVNQGSNRSPITVPDTDSQSALYRRVLAEARVDPRDVSYVEAHGTGTPVGDPIEYDSVRVALAGADRGGDNVFLGSVKDNIGHTEAASGAASVIKVILMLQHKAIPKQANFTSLNPRINASSSIVVPTSSQQWGPRRRVALINNYGAAGSNAVFLLRSVSEAEPQAVAQPSAADIEYPIVLSAKTTSSLEAYVQALRARLSNLSSKSLSLASVAHKIARSQNPSFEYRVAFTAARPEDAQTALSSSQLGQPARVNKLPVVLCFGGQTGRHVTVSKDLYDSSDLFRRHLDACDAICRALDLGSLYPAMFDSEPIDDIVQLQCMLLALQVSSANSWLDSGLVVDTLVGHSFGEIAALCVADSLSLLDAFRLVAGRARLIRDCWGPRPGAMLSVECMQSEAEAVLAVANKDEIPHERVEIACYNGPRSFVLSGDGVAIERAGAECALRGIKTVALKTTNAFHSHLAGGILPELSSVVAPLTITPPRLVRIETCTPGDETSIYTAKDMVEHIRRPVYFVNAVQRIAARLPSAVWLEAGSSTPVVSMARRIVTATNNRPTGDVFLPMNLDAVSSLARSASQLWMAGSPHSYWLFHASSRGRYDEGVHVPPYQFEKNRHWIDLKPQQPDRKEEVEAVVKDPATRLVNQVPTSDGGLLFWVDTTNVSFELAVRGHAVTGQSLCPASMYVELAALAATDALTKGQGQPKLVPQVENLVMSAPLGLTASARVLLRLSRVKDQACDFIVSSQPHGDDTSKPQAAQVSTEHASGRISWFAAEDPALDKRLKVLERFAAHGIKQLSSPRSAGVSGSMVYKLFDQVVTYADYYQGVQNVSALENESIGSVTVPPESYSWPGVRTDDGGISDPIVVDNFLQVAGIHVNCLSPREEDQVFMCTALQEVIFTSTFVEDRSRSRSWMVHSRYTEVSKGEMTNDILVCDKDTGFLVMAVLGATFRSVRFTSLARNLARLDKPKKTATKPHVEATRPTITTIVPPSTTTTAVTTDVDSSDTDYLHSMTTQTTVSPASLSDKGPGTVQPSVVQQNGVISPGGPGDLQATLREICLLISEIIEIPVEEVRPTSTLYEVGIDSLLVTDVLTDIQARFSIDIGQDDFMGCANILSAAKLIQSQLVPNGSLDNTQQDENISPENTLIPSQQNKSQKSPEAALNGVADKLGSKLGSPLADTCHTSFTAEKPSYDAHAVSTGYSGFYSDVAPLQSRLVVQYVLEAFRSLGCDLQALAPGEELPLIKYESKHTQVVAQLHRVLEDAGLVKQGDDADTRTRTGKPVPTTATAATLHYEMLARFPKHASETKLLQTTGPRLADCLTGRADPVSLIFQSAKARALLEDVYTNAPMFKTGTLLLGQYLASVVRRMASDNGQGRRELRILELGAGTGGTSKHIVETLTAALEGFSGHAGSGPLKLSYTFTDISPSLVAAAKRKFAKWSSIMEYAVVNIEEAPAAVHLGAYDIVLSTNCIHATRDLVASAAHILQMLRPDGVLCLVELTRNLYWFDLVFGLLEGWWRFDDGRVHALADEQRWKGCLRRAGFEWVDWSEGASRESETLRVITASPWKVDVPEVIVNGNGNAPRLGVNGDKGGLHDDHHEESLATMQTVTFKEVDGLKLDMDIYLPSKTVEPGKKLPIAIMIHGGGHIMLSKRDIRPAQTALLLRNGFLPISIDYRLCPETTLLSGPMTDVADALSWISTHLRHSPGLRPDVAAALDTERTVAVGWSTGGHLAMSLGWVAGVKTPKAILALYAPTDYEDPFWSAPNVPAGLGDESLDQFSLDEAAIFARPVTAYNVPKQEAAMGGWLAPADARSRLALHMNVQGRTVQLLLGGPYHPGGDNNGSDKLVSAADIRAASPLAQVRSGAYTAPTFLVHPREDDLIPWQQAERTWTALRENGVEAELKIVEGVPHLFDLPGARGGEGRKRAMEAVWEGYAFLCRQAGVVWKG